MYHFYQLSPSCAGEPSNRGEKVQHTACHEARRRAFDVQVLKGRSREVLCVCWWRLVFSKFALLPWFFVHFRICPKIKNDSRTISLSSVSILDSVHRHNQKQTASCFSVLFFPLLLFPQPSHLFSERLSTPIISFRDLSPWPSYSRALLLQHSLLNGVSQSYIRTGPLLSEPSCAVFKDNSLPAAD